VLGGVHQHEGHCQRVSHQQWTPPRLYQPPQKDRGHRRHCGMKRGNRCDQIHAGLSGVDQRSCRLQVQRSPATSRYPLDEEVGTGLASVHGAQQPAVRDVCGASEHAVRVGGATADVGRRAAGGCPRRCCRQHDVDNERGEGQRDEPSDIRCPVAAVEQPEHSRDHIRQDEKRHIDAADDHFPPRRMRHLDALLQPHGRDGAEEQPPVRLGLEMPQRRRSNQRCRSPAEVVHQQHKRERQPVAHDREYLVPSADAGGDQPGGDIEQQQFAIKCEPVRQRPVGHDKGPGSDRRPPRECQPALAGFAGVEVKVGDGYGARQRHGLRQFWTAELPGGYRLRVTLEEPGPAISCYCHQSDLILSRLFSICSFLSGSAIEPNISPETL
jgi:hypothetical protein